MSVLEAYLVLCDSCRQGLVYVADHFTPQGAIADAIGRDGWTVYAEIVHCPDCPPLCARCGKDDQPQTCEECSGGDGPR